MEIDTTKDPVEKKKPTAKDLLKQTNEIGTIVSGVIHLLNSAVHFGTDGIKFKAVALQVK
jgi:hypothetical protein